jgi:hypothetical protein
MGGGGGGVMGHWAQSSMLHALNSLSTGFFQMHICTSDNCGIYTTARITPLIAIISKVHTLHSHIVSTFFLLLHPVVGA